MKSTDDYDAKIALWARESRVYPLPKMSNLPPFKSRKFKSYAEFNAWKQQYLEEIAARGGVKWMN